MLNSSEDYAFLGLGKDWIRDFAKTKDPELKVLDSFELDEAEQFYSYFL